MKSRTCALLPAAGCVAGAISFGTAAAAAAAADDDRRDADPQHPFYQPPACCGQGQICFCKSKSCSS